MKKSERLQQFEFWQLCVKRQIEKFAETRAFPMSEGERVELQEEKDKLKELVKRLPSSKKKRSPERASLDEVNQLLKTPFRVRGHEKLPIEFGYLFLLGLSQAKRSKGDGSCIFREFVTSEENFFNLIDQSKEAQSKENQVYLARLISDYVPVFNLNPEGVFSEDEKHQDWRKSFSRKCRLSICSLFSISEVVPISEGQDKKKRFSTNDLTEDEMAWLSSGIGLKGQQEANCWTSHSCRDPAKVLNQIQNFIQYRRRRKT